MSIDVSSKTNAQCCMCGAVYSRRKGYFPVNYGALYKGTGYLPVCRSCIDEMYNKYYEICQDEKKAVRQVCRKLDLYWNESIFDYVIKKSSTRTVMTAYISRINTSTYVGMSYDDTLVEEDSLWDWNTSKIMSVKQTGKCDRPEDAVSSNAIAFWGPGYKASKYEELQARYDYWISRLPSGGNIDIGTEVIIKQICLLESEINSDRAAGKSVEKSVTLLNTLLGSANLKPAQLSAPDADAANDNTPFGVWINRFENKRPIPDPDPEFEDVDGIIKYITVWFMGHLCKMLGIKNSYCKLYEQEMEKRRVQKVEYADEEDEDLFNDIFANSPGEGD